MSYLNLTLHRVVLIDVNIEIVCSLFQVCVRATCWTQSDEPGVFFLTCSFDMFTLGYFLYFLKLKIKNQYFQQMEGMGVY